MSVIAFASAKGSPGTTTTAMALANAWPTPPVLADLDPVGGDVVWRLRDPEGKPLGPNQGLLSLGAAVRRGAGETELADHLQPTLGGHDVLVGVGTPEQVAGLGAAWGQLSTVFRSHPADVLVDCGRVAPGAASLPVLAKADVIVFVVRPDIEGVAHLRDRLRSLRDTVSLGRLGGTPVAVIVHAQYRDTSVVDDLQRLLESDDLKVRVIGVVADDAKGARVLSSTREGTVARTTLGRSARNLAARLLELAHGGVPA